MKTRFFILTLLMVSNLSILPCFAQYAAHTQFSLPEGAKARLGKGQINEITYSPDGSLLAVASSIGIWLYDAETYREVALLAGHTSSINSVSFSPDGTTIASGSDDGKIRLRCVFLHINSRKLHRHTKNAHTKVGEYAVNSYQLSVTRDF
ncbi:MAG: hypothetical protein OXI63_03525 [Candidatus Poribacteria bacterium]|nr:hypothetical protein [Candidatus Poribacteria bacterium]